MEVIQYIKRRDITGIYFLDVDLKCSMNGIKLGDILFIETSAAAHRIRVHEENRQIEFYGSLKDIQKKLIPNFYRRHKSYIVNRDKIAEVDMKSNRIIMTNEEKCYVSFRYKRGLKGCL
jgi:two-component system response regulator AgrA